MYHTPCQLPHLSMPLHCMALQVLFLMCGGGMYCSTHIHTCFVYSFDSAFKLLIPRRIVGAATRIRALIVMRQHLNAFMPF